MTENASVVDETEAVERRRKRLSPLLVLLAFLVPVKLAVLGSVLGPVLGSFYTFEPLPTPAAPPDVGEAAIDALPTGDHDRARHLQSEIDRSKTRLRSLLPRGIYIVIDVGRNRLYVKKGEQTVLEAACSTGSGLLLRDPGGERHWIFDTPRGVFRVHRKAVDPVWTKPDWAFIEEGQPPPKRWSDRVDHETLGDYALYFGDGYMIHGTLYQRYLGRSITHGCVRLGDEDLKRVYEMTPLGATVYLF